jgi:predicted transcriptional regulator
MIIELKPEHARILERAVKSGMSREQAIDQAFAILEEQFSMDDWMLANRDAVIAQIEEGFAQSERGELIDGDEAIGILQARRAARRIA